MGSYEVDRSQFVRTHQDHHYYSYHPATNTIGYHYKLLEQKSEPVSNSVPVKKSFGKKKTSGQNSIK